MNDKEKWIEKAKEHFDAGKILYEYGLYRDSLARLYYSAYSLILAECGEAPKGRWTHKGIIKCFLKKLYEKNIELNREAIKLLKIFYEERRKADYSVQSVERERVNDYINLVKMLMEVIKDGKN